MICGTPLCTNWSVPNLSMKAGTLAVWNASTYTLSRFYHFCMKLYVGNLEKQWLDAGKFHNHLRVVLKDTRHELYGVYNRDMMLEYQIKKMCFLVAFGYVCHFLKRRQCSICQMIETTHYVSFFLFWGFWILQIRKTNISNLDIGSFSR